MIKDTSKSFQRSFYLVIAYGLAFGLGYITRLYNPQFTFSFYVSEQKFVATYQISLKDLLDIVFIAPFFAVLSFLLIKRLLDDLKMKGIEDNKITLYYLVFIIAIVIFSSGNIAHVLLNRLNADVIDDYNTQSFYYMIYYIDEFIGHHLITIGFFIVLSEICFLHTLDLQKRLGSDEYSGVLLRDREPFWNYIFGIGLGVGTSFTYLEGQCAFLFLILNPVLCALVIFQSRKYGIKIKENGLLIMIILMTITFITIVLIWSIVTGIKPYYPFFYQNSEVNIF